MVDCPQVAKADGSAVPVTVRIKHSDTFGYRAGSGKTQVRIKLSSSTATVLNAVNKDKFGWYVMNPDLDKGEYTGTYRVNIANKVEETVELKVNYYVFPGEFQTATGTYELDRNKQFAGTESDFRVRALDRMSVDNDTTALLSPDRKIVFSNRK